MPKSDVILILFSKRFFSKTKAQVPCRLNNSRLKYTFMIKIRLKFMEMIVAIILMLNLSMNSTNSYYLLQICKNGIPLERVS